MRMYASRKKSDTEQTRHTARMLQRARQHGTISSHPAPTQRSAVDNVLRSPGQPLAAPLKEEMEARLGADFSYVRVHTDATARASATEVGARAYTSGSHVVIGDGGADKHTLAHELTHVMQQWHGPVTGTDNGGGLRVSDPSDWYEQAAKANAEWVMNGPALVRRAVATAPREEGSDTSAVPTDTVVQCAPIRTRTDVQRNQHNPPFPFRYAYQGPNYMQTITSGSGGLVQYPQTGLPERMETETTQMSVVSGSRYAALPSGGRRAVTQSAVMDAVSPNDAARALGLPCPNRRAWEWLHLVAFSIRQTHVDSFSVQSMELMTRTSQPQQIRENLVLGSAATNTAMLSYETAIKSIMKNHRDWHLDLFVAAGKQDRQVLNSRGQEVTIPVGTHINYHFMFKIPDDRVIPPVVLSFNLQTHQPPPKSEYTEVVNTLKEHIEQSFALDVHGMRTTGFVRLRGNPPAAPLAESPDMGSSNLLRRS